MSMPGAMPQTPAPWFASTQSSAPPRGEQDMALPSALPTGASYHTVPSSPSPLRATFASSSRSNSTCSSPVSAVGLDDDPLQTSPFAPRTRKPKTRGLSLLIPERSASGSVPEETREEAQYAGEPAGGAGLPPKMLQPPPSSGLAARRKGKMKGIMLTPPALHDGPMLGSRSVPSSPLFVHQFGAGAGGSKADDPALDYDEQEHQAQKELVTTMKGAPRRRPSLLLPVQRIASAAPAASASRIPAAWRDPSEHPLTGAGSTAQHARSVYSRGPIEVLPGLFLGDEHNACDGDMLSAFGITTILNVAKETTLPFQFSADAAPLLRAPLIGVSPAEDERRPSVDTQSGSRTIPARLSVSSSRSGGSQHVAPLDLPPQMPYLRPHTSTPNLTRSYSQLSDASQGAHSSKAEALPAEAEQSEPGQEIEFDIGPEGYPPLRSLRDLPPTATALTIPPSALSTAGGKARMHALRYVKLPWTHDEVDLATKEGGFRHGCALIAETLGLVVDDDGVPSNAAGALPNGNGRILVHCQCGVSRSATLVIAFVMQAAALGYDFSQTKALQGMHDCYNLVKDASSSISPNCSLIYQLVEWERALSAQATRLREQQAAAAPSQSAAAVHSIPHSGGWTASAIDEDEWMRMRAEEERKEQQEKAAQQQQAQDQAEAQGELPAAGPQQEEGAAPVLSLAPAAAARKAGKKALPQLNLQDGARARIDRAQSVNAEAAEAVTDSLSRLTVGRADEAREQPLVSAAPAKTSFAAGGLNGFPARPGGLTLAQRRLSRLNHGDSAAVAGAAPDRAPAAAALAPLGPAAAAAPSGFGAKGESVAERKSKHKRTFSTEWPTKPNMTSVAPAP